MHGVVRVEYLNKYLHLHSLRWRQGQGFPEILSRVVISAWARSELGLRICRGLAPDNAERSQSVHCNYEIYLLELQANLREV